MTRNLPPLPSRSGMMGGVGKDAGGLCSGERFILLPLTALSVFGLWSGHPCIGLSGLATRPPPLSERNEGERGRGWRPMRTDDNGRCRHFPDLTHCGSAISPTLSTHKNSTRGWGREGCVCFGREGYYNNNINNVGYRRLHTAGYVYVYVYV